MTDKKQPETLLEALFLVQTDAPIVSKNAVNPHFKSKYADLPGIWSVIKDIICANKLLVNHTLEENEEGVPFIKTKITFIPTGEAIQSLTRINLKANTAQEYGSYITYMRRYAISSMLGIITDDDDDGNAATVAQKTNNEKSKAAKEENQPKSPLQEKAASIKKQLSECTTPETLNYVWKGFADALAAIKAASPDKAYPALERFYAERLAATSQAPLSDDKIPY